uniref:Uncharacterized protein n=1 Tax=Kuenenia stuttgartiensis TaxID=174633 RepID=Q1Q7Q6_KUEST|nr:unknown protein [Candidatus Kuenenia stuttgartiensis]
MLKKLVITFVGQVRQRPFLLTHLFLLNLLTLPLRDQQVLPFHKFSRCCP